ncbi:hypothetical protein R3P38DRAFT_2747161 [Favolaschia claudopus]|uniref:F-box domain-containing protein n=1 Tax=Favolaschia claudopus TaxID=2862362 RepID=A0AAV9ZEB5_9AGAR
MTTTAFIRTELLSLLPQKTRIRENTRSYSPPPTDLRSIIDSIRPELSRYDAEISRLRAELKILEEDRLELETFHDECYSLLSPIRRLPPEILSHIFAQHDLASTPILDNAQPPQPPLPTAFLRLAHGPLMVVSQVCARWHDIAIGTPTLWESVDLESILWETSDRVTAKMMGILEEVLERGRNSSLFIAIRAPGGTHLHIPSLELLAKHAERWKWISIAGLSLDLTGLSAARGNMPRLTSLSLYGDFSANSISTFKDAPRLESAEFGCTPGSWDVLQQLPLSQIRSLMCFEPLGFAAAMGNNPLPCLALLSHLVAPVDFELRLTPTVIHHNWDLTPPIPHTTSNISSLLIEFLQHFPEPQIGVTVAKILDSLTLPAIKQIEFDAEQYSVPWPHNEFLALGKRSGFSTQLQALHLWDVVITQYELIECLGELPVLERLALSDFPADIVSDAPEHLLITDDLLVTLEDRSIVPRLASLGLQGLLKFDNEVLLKLILLRLDLLGDGEFNVELYWLKGCFREFEKDIEDRISQLKRCQFFFGPANDEIIGDPE